VNENLDVEVVHLHIQTIKQNTVLFKTFSEIVFSSIETKV